MISAFHLIYPFTFPFRVLLSFPPSSSSSSSSYYVINARKLSLSLFFSLSTICPLWKKGEPLNVSFSPLPPSLSPHLCHFRSVQFFFTHPSNASFSVPSGVSSPIWINEPTLFPSSTSNCPSIRPVRDSPRNEPLYVYIYSTGICEILFPSFFPPPFFLLFLSYFLILVFLSGSLVFSGVPFFHWFFIEENVKSSNFFHLQLIPFFWIWNLRRKNVSLNRKYLFREVVLILIF